MQQGDSHGFPAVSLAHSGASLQQQEEEGETQYESALYYPSTESQTDRCLWLAFEAILLRE